MAQLEYAPIHPFQRRFALAEQISESPLIVQPPFMSRQGELVLIKPPDWRGDRFWGVLLDPIDESDDWTCRRLTDQEFADHIRSSLQEEEKSRAWSAERILAMHKGIPA